ncbi:MAG: two-component system response regulator, partial [Blastochloris sp.]|nr:two-component system response regulator [Blastochloris sp.]
YDALGSDRPYRKRWSLERIKAYLDEQAGVHFDPTVVHLFLQHIENIQNLNKEQG